jgi:putative flippase GtrA
MTDITGFRIAVGLVATRVALGSALLLVDLQWLATAAATLVARLIRSTDNQSR